MWSSGKGCKGGVLGVLCLEAVSQGDVLLLCGLLGLALVSTPGIPLGLSLHVKHAGAG